MVRRLPVVAAAVVLFAATVLAWHALRVDGAELAPALAEQDAVRGDAVPPARQVPVGSGGDPATRAGVTTDAPSAAHMRRVLEPARRTERILEDQVVRVCVVEGASQTPAHGAAVRYMPLDGAAELGDAGRRQLHMLLQGLSAGGDDTLDRFGFAADPDDQGVVTVRVSPGGTVVRGRSGDLTGELWIGPGAPTPVGGWQLELRAAWALRVQVVDGDGRPVPRLPVALVGRYAPHDHGGPRTIVAALGTTRADDGVLEHPDAGQLLARWNRHGELTRTGCAPCLPGLLDTVVSFDPRQPPDGVLRLVLPATGGLRVEIADAAGQPVTGASWVRVRTEGDDPRDVRGSAGGGGVIAFPWVGLGRTYVVEAHAGAATGAATVPGPGAPGQQVSVRITLPASAKIVVRLTDAAGRPMPVTGYVDLRKGGGGRVLRQARFAADGVATLSRVPSAEGMEVIASCCGRRLPATVVGPVAAGATVEVAIALPPAPILAGRALDPEGNPLVGRRIRVLYGAAARDGSGVAGTDGEGRFQHVLADGLVGRRLQLLQLVLRDPEGADTATVSQPALPAPLPAGITDLGDVVFREAALLVSGRLTGYRHAPGAAPPALVVQRLAPGGDAPEWRAEATLHQVLEETGAFAVRGAPRPGRLRLAVVADRYLPVAPIGFLPGATDLQVPLVLGGAVVLGVRVDSAVGPAILRARLVPTGAGSTGGCSAGTLERQGSRSPLGSADLACRWVGLTPGSYRVEIGPALCRQPSVTIADVAVRAGQETRDPRLVRVDLRGRVRSIPVRVVARLRGGEAVVPDGSVLHVTRDDLSATAGVVVQGGAVTFVVPEPGVYRVGGTVVGLRGRVDPATIEVLDAAGEQGIEVVLDAARDR